uniref:Uncharacterized protein n=1 Tax=Plectus sambesii TaxID=2011161 RepID=A0A914V522_9BILA
MAAIMNAGYSDFGAIALTDTRLKIVSILDQTKMIGYKLAAVNVNDNATEPTFHVNIPKVPSGTTAYIRYNLTVEEVALVQDFSVAVMMDGGPVPIADKRKFFIEHALPDRLLVTVDGRPSEFYLYSLK